MGDFDDLDEIAKAVERRRTGGQQSFEEFAQSLPTAPRVRPIVYAQARTRRRTYRQRVGLRSIILQMAFAAWSLLCGSLAAFVIYDGVAGRMMLSDLAPTINPSFDQPTPENRLGRDNKIRGAIAASIDIGFVWGVVALPLGIAAVVVIKPEN